MTPFGTCPDHAQPNTAVGGCDVCHRERAVIERLRRLRAESERLRAENDQLRAEIDRLRAEEYGGEDDDR